MKKTLLSLSFASLFAALAGPAAAVEQRPYLTLDVAKKMAAACEAKARQEGWKMNIAIVDSGGNLKYFLRQDDAFLKSIEIAQLKAGTSAGFPFSTKQIGEIAQKVPGIANVPGIVTFEGGLPILTADGRQVGAIGVSGGTAEQDGSCAQAGIDATKSDLK
ncbi:MAG TPA: heme-binding protein [Burkholderiales bacterium]|nr:heme-binding protein [Burkholderiales bacterium]